MGKVDEEELEDKFEEGLRAVYHRELEMQAEN